MPDWHGSVLARVGLSRDKGPRQRSGGAFVTWGQRSGGAFVIWDRPGDRLRIELVVPQRGKGVFEMFDLRSPLAWRPGYGYYVESGRVFQQAVTL